MPTVNLSISASADDCRSHRSSGCDPAQIELTNAAGIVIDNDASCLDNNWIGGFRFLNALIDQGAIINSATFTMHGDIQTGFGAQFVVYGNDIDDALPWAFVADEMPHDVERTSASKPHTQAFGSDVDIVVNVQSIIQEIVNRPGWASGNDISLIVEDDGPDFEFLVESIDQAGSPTVATLDIDWEANPGERNPGVARGSIGSDSIGKGSIALPRSSVLT